MVYRALLFSFISDERLKLILRLFAIFMFKFTKLSFRGRRKVKTIDENGVLSLYK